MATSGWSPTLIGVGDLIESLSMTDVLSSDAPVTSPGWSPPLIGVGGIADSLGAVDGSDVEVDGDSSATEPVSIADAITIAQGPDISLVLADTLGILDVAGVGPGLPSDTVDTAGITDALAVVLTTAALTATPVPSLGFIRLSWGAIAVEELWRTDANGTRPVRTLAGLLPASSGVVEDYEAALSGTVAYTALGPGVTESASAAMGGDLTWLNIPVAPAYATTLDLVTGLAADRDSMGTVHEVIGREDPLPVLGGLRKRGGRLSIHCPTWAKASAVVDLYSRRKVLLLRQPDYAGLDLWHVPVKVSTSVDTESLRWTVEVEYREVSPQTGPLTGTLGRSWADVIAEQPTWLSAQATYDTWADLMVGPS